MLLSSSSAGYSLTSVHTRDGSGREEEPMRRCSIMARNVLDDVQLSSDFSVASLFRFEKPRHPCSVRKQTERRIPLLNPFSDMINVSRQ
jgi:hypothetical protein